MVLSRMNHTLESIKLLRKRPQLGLYYNYAVILQFSSSHTCIDQFKLLENSHFLPVELEVSCSKTIKDLDDSKSLICCNMISH